MPNNKTDAEVAKQLIKKLKVIFKFQNDPIFIGDAASDEAIEKGIEILVGLAKDKKQ